MAKIKDCEGRKIKISKASITIKDDAGKTCRVVRNIISLYDLQPNKQMDFYKILKNLGLYGKISIKNCIISENTMYVFRNIKSKLYTEKHGYFDEQEKEKSEEQENVYQILKNNNIDVIECIFY